MREISLGIGLALVLLFGLGVHSQVHLPAPPPPQTEPATNVDPLGRETPRGAIMGLLKHSADASTRNVLDLSGNHLLPWKNYFYAGLGSFPQSPAQGITLQSTLGVAWSATSKTPT